MWYAAGYMLLILVVVGLVCFLLGLLKGKNVDIRITTKKIRPIGKGRKSK